MMKLYVSNGKVFVWNAEDAYTLRKDHHIAGTLVGCYPQKSFQNLHKWLPLQLSSEEATLLRDKGVAKLYASPNMIPGDSIAQSYFERRDKLCEEQIALMRENRQKTILEKANEIYEGKKRKYVEMLTGGKPQKDKDEHEEKAESHGTTEETEQKKMPTTKSNDENVEVCHPEKSKLEVNTDECPSKSSELNEIAENQSDETSDLQKSHEELTDKSSPLDKNAEELPDKEHYHELDKDEDTLLSVPKVSQENSRNKDMSNDTSSQMGQSEKLETSKGIVTESADAETSKDKIIGAELSKVSVVKKELCMVQQFTECSWKNSVETEVTSWKFPANNEENLRYAVFKDLWEKGYYLTAGSKFGGDFLAYEGDPLKYHALYIIICLPHDKDFQAIDLVVYGRLGNQVKKTAVLASLNGDNVEYISLKWLPEI